MKQIFTSLCILSSLIGNAQLIAEWNFNSNPNDLNLTTGSFMPNVGSGTISNIGFVTHSFDGASGSSDPALTDNTCYSTNNYPNETQNDKSAGIEIAVNTVGVSNIVLKFNIRCLHNSANEYVVQYSTDGINFLDYHTIKIDPINAAVFVNDNVIDFSTVSALNNNPLVKFRIISSFAGTGSAYVAVNDPIDTYSPTANVSFDLLSVTALSPLPVKLTAFTGSYTNNNSHLKWTTANEINIDKYAVERSYDGRIFAEIGYVNANGRNNYYYIDTTAKSKIIFYRLRIIGVNEIKYSTIIKMLLDDDNVKLNVFPSPSVQFIYAEFTTKDKMMATVQITDAAGKTVLQKDIQIKEGYNKFNMDVGTLNKGTYFINIITPGNNMSSNFQKL